MEERFRKKLQEQLGFLERSCTAFDSGLEDEGFRIAAALRILFHDTNSMTSLLDHLGLREGQMLSTSRGHGDYKDYLQIRIDLSSSTPVRAIPMLKQRFHPMSFNQWWRHEAVFVWEGQPYQRRKVVLSAADKDGSAHVDRTLEPYYDALCTGKFTLGLTGDLKYRGAVPFEQGVTQWAPNAHVALLRQFAFETLASAKNYRWLESSNRII